MNNAGTDGSSHLNPVREVRRPYATIKPVRRVVCQPDGLLLGVVRDDDDDGPEDLLLSDGHRVVDVGKERRPDVEALGERGIIERLEAAGDDARTLVDTLLDVSLDLVPLALADNRADVGVRVQRVAHGDALDHRLEGVHDLVVAVSWGEDARVSDARIGVVSE